MAGAEDKADLLRARLRTGEVTGEQLFAAAQRGDDASRLALGLDVPQVSLLTALGGYGKTPKTGAQAENALRAFYQAKGYRSDRYGALVSPDGSSRIVFKDKVFEEYRGRPGAWSKEGGSSKLKHAELLAAEANGRLLQLREKRRVEKKKAVEREEKTATRKNILRTAAVLLSIDLTPEERRESLVSGDFEEELVARTNFYLPEIERTLSSDATPKQIDAALSVDSPPVFLPSSNKVGEEWPTSHKWVDATTKLPIELKREDESVVIRIGNVPVNPLTGGVEAFRFAESITQETPPQAPRIVACTACGAKNRVEAERALLRSLCGACKAPLPIVVECEGCGQKNRIDPSRVGHEPICGACGVRLEIEEGESAPKRGFTGISGVIRVGRAGVEPQLYYIQSARQRQGMGRRMIRLFCRIVSAYGFRSFVAIAAGTEGKTMLSGLESEGEIQILGWKGSSALVRCDAALEDPRQTRLFGPQPKLNPESWS